MEYIVDLYIFVLVLGLSVSDGVDYASPLVFDANFYVNSNGRKMHNIHTVAQAKEHWLNHGIDDGLQGIGSFHSKQYIARYLDDILTIDNPVFEKYKNVIYPQELTLNKASVTNTETPFLDLNIKIINGEIHTRVYDKRDDFGFNIVNFPWLDGDVPRLPSYGIYISQLIRYPDLSSVYHSNYRQAIHHYLTIGHSHEKRIGVLNHYDNRWSINSHDITIGTSRRFGGAVESLTWNNKELVNSYDHGRQIQMACNSDSYTECYNPTEAGGRNDGISDTTHTHINWVRASGNVLETEVYPAFWLIPGSHEKRAKLCQRGHPAMNHQGTYSYPFHKKVVIGAHGINNVIQFDSNFTLGGDWPQDLNYIQMEAPATYLNGDINQMYNFNHQKNLVENHHTNRLPTVLSTPDHQYAMGIYSPPGQPSDTFMNYNIQDFHIKSPFSSTTKLDVVYRKRRFHGNGPVTQIYTSYLCVGTLGDVSDCMGKIMNAVPRV